MDIPTTHTPDLATMRKLAEGYLTSQHDALQLQCDACGRTVDTYISDREVDRMARVQEVTALLAHTAFEHVSRATVLEVRSTPAIRWEA